MSQIEARSDGTAGCYIAAPTYGLGPDGCCASRQNTGLIEQEALASSKASTLPARWIFHAWGSNNLMWSNDYPHPNSTWPKSWDVITRDLGHLSEETRSRLLQENVRQLYKLPALPPVAV